MFSAGVVTKPLMTRLRIFCALSLLALCGGATCTPAREPVVQPALQAARPLIGPSDLVEVRIFGEPELSGSFRVDGRGALSLPLVGEVLVDGLTPDEARVAIETAYNRDYLKNAQITVLVRESTSRKVVVLGEVGKPGTYPYEERMSVIDAIARAGGTARLADVNRTIITRTQDGTKQTMTVRVGDIRSGRAADVEVMPGDIVFVPELLF